MWKGLEMDMKQLSVTDEWLYQYMPVVDEAIIRELEDNTDYEYQFTGKFERRMRKLMRHEAHPWVGTFFRLSKKAAVLLVCAVSILFVMTMSVEARRVRFFETVKTILEDSMVYSYFTELDQGTMQYVEPGYIPEGYQEIERDVSERWLGIIYSNQNEELITWDQMMVQDGEELIVDTEYDQQITKEVNGKNIIIWRRSDETVIAYCEYGKYAYLLIADNLGIDEVCMVFKNTIIE